MKPVWRNGEWKLVPPERNIPVGPCKSLIDPMPNSESYYEDKAFRRLADAKPSERWSIVHIWRTDDNPIVDDPAVASIMASPHPSDRAADMEKLRSLMAKMEDKP